MNLEMVRKYLKKYFQFLWNKAEKDNINNIFSLLEYNSTAVLLCCGCDDGELSLKIAAKVEPKIYLGSRLIRGQLIR